MENQQAGKDVTVTAFNLDVHTSKWGYPGRKSDTQVSFEINFAYLKIKKLSRPFFFVFSGKV